MLDTYTEQKPNLFELTMCLAVPGRICELFVHHDLRMAMVDFDGVTRRVCAEYVPDASIGDYVLVHVGFALSIVEETEARRLNDYLARLSAVEEPEGES